LGTERIRVVMEDVVLLTGKFYLHDILFADQNFRIDDDSQWSIFFETELGFKAHIDMHVFWFRDSAGECFSSWSGHQCIINARRERESAIAEETHSRSCPPPVFAYICIYSVVADPQNEVSGFRPIISVSERLVITIYTTPLP
jgi:hypothetical protein